MANSKKTELATVGSFELTVNRFEGLSPEDLEELKDQMEDLDQDTGIACRLIKIPSGGKLAYEVQTGEDETDVDYMKEVALTATGPALLAPMTTRSRPAPAWTARPPYGPTQGKCGPARIAP